MRMWHGFTEVKFILSLFCAALSFLAVMTAGISSGARASVILGRSLAGFAVAGVLAYVLAIVAEFKGLVGLSANWLMFFRDEEAEEVSLEEGQVDEGVEVESAQEDAVEADAEEVGPSAADVEVNYTDEDETEQVDDTAEEGGFTPLADGDLEHVEAPPDGK